MRLIKSASSALVGGVFKYSMTRGSMPAYGWPEDISDDDAVAMLFELNQSSSSRAPADDRRRRSSDGPPRVDPKASAPV
jgi:hypothetical protein